VAFAAESDFLDSHGDALMSLTDVLQLADRLDDAGTALEQAASLYAQKGNIVSAAKARARLESISGVTEPLEHGRGTTAAVCLRGGLL